MIASPSKPQGREEHQVDESQWMLLGQQWQKFSDVSLSADGSTYWALGSEKAGFGGYAIYLFNDG
jgi:hypothetical protein